MQYSVAKRRYGSQQILTVPAKLTQTISSGLSSAEKINELIFASKYVFRFDAEGNPALKQLIPYIIVQRQTDKKFFVYQRKSGEFSIGVSGHVVPQDSYHADLLKRTAQRCLEEKLILQHEGGLITSSLVYAEETPEHLGIVYSLIVQDAMPKLRLYAKYWGWKTLAELVDQYGIYEEWSKYLIDQFYVKNKKKEVVA